MPRVARTAPKGYIYHVLTRGNNRQNVFTEEQDYKNYLDILLKYKDKYHFKLYHYVLMTNHVHLVMEVAEQGGDLSQIMKGINLSYVQFYKTNYEHVGHFWQDRFKSIIISKDNYLLACGSYVELNPVRAKMVADPKDYRWSSYNTYAYGKKDILVDEHPIYENFSKDKLARREKYREFVKGMMRENEAMRCEMAGRLIYGSEDFIRHLGKEYEINAVIKQRGRPRKADDGNTQYNK
jgi:putative transposase